MPTPRDRFGYGPPPVAAYTPTIPFIGVIAALILLPFSLLWPLPAACRTSAPAGAAATRR